MPLNATFPLRYPLVTDPFAHVEAGLLLIGVGISACLLPSVPKGGRGVCVWMCRWDQIPYAGMRGEPCTIGRQSALLFRRGDSAVYFGPKTTGFGPEPEKTP